jgi:uncharacterized protein YraI
MSSRTSGTQPGILHISAPSSGVHAPFFYRIIGLVALLLTAGIVSACGPAREDGDTVGETIRIAQEFRQDGDLSRARIQLESLEVANVLSWLVYIAEERISEAAGSAETHAVVALALAMGGSSGAIRTYALQNGLLAEPTPPPQPVAQAVPPIAPVAPAQEPVVPQAQIVVPTETPAAAVDAAPAEAPAEAPAAAPTETPITNPQVRASTSLNVRGGPGTNYPVVGALEGGSQADIVAKNPAGDWWQVTMPNGQQGWVYGQLVEAAGDTTSVAVAANIPEPPPVPPTATPAPVAEPPPAEPAPAEPQLPAPAPSGGPDFRVVEKRLWDVYENGGSLSGPTVVCGEKRQLVVNVIDANGNRVNGVAVQALFGAQEIYVTGVQGKGDGAVEFVLGRGQDVKVVRDADGREVSSEVAAGLTTEPGNIPYDKLIAGRYCTDDASCKRFVDAPGCWGHYSWTVTFQRNY